MKTKNANVILKYSFEDSKIAIRLPIVINFIIAAFLIIFDRNNPYLIYCFSSAILVLAFYLLYSWKEPSLNFLVTMLYLLIFFAELIFEGLPKQALEPEGDISKGIFLDLSLFILPYIYVGLRFLAVIPLFRVTYLSYKLKQ